MLINYSDNVIWELCLHPVRVCQGSPFLGRSPQLECEPIDFVSGRFALEPYDLSVGWERLHFAPRLWLRKRVPCLVKLVLAVLVDQSESLHLSVSLIYSRLDPCDPLSVVDVNGAHGLRIPGSLCPAPGRGRSIVEDELDLAETEHVAGGRIVHLGDTPILRKVKACQFFLRRPSSLVFFLPVPEYYFALEQAVSV